MKKKFTEAQIIFALRQARSGTPIAEIIRKMEISDDKQMLQDALSKKF